VGNLAHRGRPPKGGGWKPKTERGKRLFALREAILASGPPLLTLSQINRLRRLGQ